jgi:ATP-dependent RNA helicase DDX1
MAAFAEVGVMPEIIRALEEQGWQLPTPIQQEAVPLILGYAQFSFSMPCIFLCCPRGFCKDRQHADACLWLYGCSGGDVMGAAETGSGKTGAFGIPILQLVHEAMRGGDSDGNSAGGPGSESFLSYFAM